MFSQLFTWIEVNWGETINWGWGWNYELRLTWIEVKLISNQYRFHIGHFDRNEVSNRHEIFIWTKFTRSEINKRKLVGYCFNTHVRLKLIAGVISLRSFWQKWNFISGDKILCRHYPTWNAYACQSKCQVVLKCSRNETSREQILFSRGLKSQTGISNWPSASHVNIL